MPYLQPVPESAMRFFRPIGMALLACLLALPLALVVDFVAGPFNRDQMQYVVPAVAAVLFWPLMRYSRHRRERAAARARSTEANLAGDADAIDYGPPGGANLLVAGTIAVLLAAMTLWVLAQGDVEEPGRQLEGGLVFATAGVGAILLGIRRVRARRAWRASRGR